MEITPDGLDKVFFSDNGSTAVEAAIKMAIQYWKLLGEDRTEILALDHAYHGERSAQCPPVREDILQIHSRNFFFMFIGFRFQILWNQKAKFSSSKCFEKQESKIRLPLSFTNRFYLDLVEC